MKPRKRMKLCGCDIACLARREAERVLEALDDDCGHELSEAPPEVRRIIYNLAVAHVLEVVNMPDAILSSVDGRVASILKDYEVVCERFRAELMGLCSDLHEMHPESAGPVCDKRDMSNVGSLPDSSGPVKPEESGLVCVDCRRSVLEREPMWSVNVHREIFKDGAISVLQADCHLVLCEECAGKRDFNRVAVPLRTVTQVRVAGPAVSISRFENVVESNNGLRPMQ